MRSVLVVIAADPRSSPRALEALRMGVGLSLGRNRVTVALDPDVGGGGEPAATAFVDYHRAAEYLAALDELGGCVVSGEEIPARIRSSDVVIRWTE